MDTYRYHRPKTLEQAFELRSDEPDARWVAGGTDLFVQLRKRRAEAPSALISLRHIDELRGIELLPASTGATRLRIGAGVPLSEVAMDPLVAAHLPALVQSIAVLGSRQIRNVATLGGNLCNASPGADCAPPLLVYGAHLELRGPGGTRELALDEFFMGPGATCLASGELLCALLIESPAPASRCVFLRKGRVAMDIAIASVALQVESEGRRIVRARAAAGSVAPVPLRLRSVETLLTGAEPDAQLLRRAQTATGAEIAPISDLRASEGYRRKLTGVLLRRALETFFPVEALA